MFIGIGYDAHRFKKGRKLILGGIHIKHPQGLDGHSDADVLIHALMDALLGAAGMEDIGHVFPNTDARLKNISSIKLLEKVILKLKAKRLYVHNIDIALIIEKPKVSPHIKKMKKTLAKTLSIPITRIGIKATTNETMGFIGRGEGAAAMAVALINSK